MLNLMFQPLLKILNEPQGPPQRLD